MATRSWCLSDKPTPLALRSNCSPRGSNPSHNDSHWSGTMLNRIIPSSGEKLPVIGCGTYRGFDVPLRGSAYDRLPGVLEALFAAGGSVIDSSPMYGRAEAVAGA